MNRRNDRFVIDPGRIEPERVDQRGDDASAKADAGGLADRPECGAGRSRPHHPTPGDSSPSSTLGERILRLANIAATMHMGMAAEHHVPSVRQASPRSYPESEVA